MARSFSATTDRVGSAFTTEYTVSTIAIWLYRNNDTLTRDVWKKGDAAGISWFLEYLAAPSSYYFFSQHSTTGGAWYALTPPAIGSWHHVVVAYDGALTTNNAVIYYNGVSQTVTQDVVPVGTLSTVTTPWELGTGNWSGNPWDGRLADFGLWNRILSASEVNAVYQVGVQAIPDYKLWIPVWGADSPEPEFRDTGGGSATVTGTTRTGDHAPVRPVSRPYWGSLGFSAPVTSGKPGGVLVAYGRPRPDHVQ